MSQLHMSPGGRGPHGLRSFQNADAPTDKKIDWILARRAFKYARPYRLLMTGLIVLVIAHAAIDAALPLVFKNIIDHGVATGDRGAVVTLAVLAGILTLLSSASTLLERWLSARIGEGVVRDMRVDVFEHVQTMPLAFFSRTKTGALVQRLNGDIVGAQRVLSTTISTITSNVFTVLFTLSAMVALSWQLTFASLLLLPLFIFAARWIGPRMARLTRESYEINADLGQFMNERFNVGGALLVKSYGNSATESDSYRGRAQRVHDIGIKSAMLSTSFRVSLTTVTAMALVLVYGLGGVLAIGGSLTIGALVALTTYLTRLYNPLTALSNVQVDILTALVSFERIFEILDLDPPVRDPDSPRSLDAAIAKNGASITLENVNFNYHALETLNLDSLEAMRTSGPMPQQDILRNLTLTLPPGKTLALVGTSGSGKTTTTHLLSRMYDPVGGAVRIAGEDLREVALSDINANVGIVPQDAYLFHDTIGANLRYANPQASDEQLRDVLSQVNLDGLLGTLPDGLDTVVGDHGYRLSGGERQRLAIARLLLKNPPIVILDEATAHLDSHNEAAVQEALGHALSGRTSVVVAHRLATIRHADLIGVLAEGELKELGTHEELLALGGHYFDLYAAQLDEDPVAAL